MAANDDHYQVIIVGAGPVGLSLANKLALEGLKILVLEKNEQIAEHSRAPAIWPKTQEILAQLKVVDTFLEKGIQLPVVCIWDADRQKRLLTAPIKALKNETAFPQLLLLPQSETERILLKAAADYKNVTVLFSCEVIGVYQNNSDVKVTYSGTTGKVTVHAEIVIGADGAHSFVRESIHASLAGKTYPVKAALADISLNKKVSMDCFRIRRYGNLAIGIPINEKTWRVIFPIPKKLKHIPLSNLLDDAVHRLFGRDAYNCTWMSDFDIHNRLSSSFCEGRVVLAGDAAHLNSPVGGQGMNAGIQDIVPLGNAVIQSLKSNNTEAIVRYSKERRSIIKKGVNSFTDRLTNAPALCKWTVYQTGIWFYQHPYAYTMGAYEDFEKNCDAEIMSSYL